MGDTKPLLFIDHDKAKLWYFDIVRQNPMRADNNVNIAFFC